jgi:signal peptidase I
MLSSLTESDLIPPGASAAGLSRCFVYNGPSMRPTFRPGHLLYVRPEAHRIAPGDVIVFAREEGHVVHRVIAVTASGLITRGDNNRLNDPQPITPEQVIGRVELVGDKDRLRPVRGGRTGLVAARFGWAVRRVMLWLRRAFWKPYDALRRFSPSRRLLARLFASQVAQVHLQTPDGALIKTVFRGRTVARWWPDQRRYECLKPFDLFLCPALTKLDE